MKIRDEGLLRPTGIATSRTAVAAAVAALRGCSMGKGPPEAPLYSYFSRVINVKE